MLGTVSYIDYKRKYLLFLLDNQGVFVVGGMIQTENISCKMFFILFSMGLSFWIYAIHTRIFSTVKIEKKTFGIVYDCYKSWPKWGGYAVCLKWKEIVW